MISHHFLAAIGTCIMGISTANLSAAAFGDENWSGIGDILNGGPLPRLTAGVSAVETDGSGNLYIGGKFTMAGGVFATNIAKWNGSSWSALGSGMGYSNSFPEVHALTVSGKVLYAGGYFTTAGGNAANYIAKWNGSSWSALGSGVDFIVYALAMSGSNVYAGGDFASAGGNAANYIAKWNGSSWSSLGSGVNGIVYALLVSGTNLYAGGDFTMAGGNEANYIARWDGSSWSPVGSGMGGGRFGDVEALAMLGSDLYAGGSFDTAGGVSATNIAKWNGSSWSALGSGICGPDDDEDYFGGWVSALAVSDGALYAGGHFSTAGGMSVANIAKWNGNSWSALGSGTGGFGLNPPVWALAVESNNLYAGGYFWTVAGKPSQNLVKARIGSIAQSVALTNSTPTIQFSGVTGYQYEVQRATNLTSPITWTIITSSPLSPAPNGSFKFVDTNAPSGQTFYRTRELP